MQNSNKIHSNDIIYAGSDIENAEQALLMVHGRGGSAGDILSLAQYLDIKDFALLAPQATNNTWYPYSFLTPQSENEPWLSSALEILEKMVEHLENRGIARKKIYFAGFSQGACLTLEF